MTTRRLHCTATITVQTTGESFGDVNLRDTNYIELESMTVLYLLEFKTEAGI